MKSRHIKILTAATLLILAPQIAFAHAHLVEANPAEKALIQEKPTQVVIKFSEELEPSLSKIEVKELTTGKVVSANKTETTGDGRDTLQVALNSIGESKGKFQVNWKVVSKDSHKMKGSYEFTVGTKTDEKVK